MLADYRRLERQVRWVVMVVISAAVALPLRAIAWQQSGPPQAFQTPNAAPPSGPPSQPPANQATPLRRQTVVGLPELRQGAQGRMAIEPNVVIAPEDAIRTRRFPQDGQLIDPIPDTSIWERFAQKLSLMPSDAEIIGPSTPDDLAPAEELFFPPLEAIPYDGQNDSRAHPVFHHVLGALHKDPCDCCNDDGFLSRLLPTFGPPGGGIGRERLAYAPFELDVAQPLNNYRFRLDLADDFRLPDRAEYFWSRPGRGPMQDQAVSYQDFRLLLESGGPKFSLGTEIPIRVLDPEINGNTAGLSDVNLTTKTVLLDGSEWQITQIFRSYFNSGASRKGLGSGHISLEPGFLFRYAAADDLYWHGVLQYWIPIAGDPIHSGQILKYGAGWSHLLYDSDSFAILDTFELVGWSILDGQKLDPDTGLPIEIDGEAVVHAYPGLRCVHDTGGDLGLIEFGISGTWGMGQSRWLDNLVRMEIRFSY